MKEVGEEEAAPPTINGAHTTDDDDDDDDANLEEAAAAAAIKYLERYCTSIANINFCFCETHCLLYH